MKYFFAYLTIQKQFILTDRIKIGDLMRRIFFLFIIISSLFLITACSGEITSENFLNGLFSFGTPTVDSSSESNSLYSTIGNVWEETEGPTGEWKGTWTLRNGTEIFDAIWQRKDLSKGSNAVYADVKVISLKNNEIILYRSNERSLEPIQSEFYYYGIISDDGKYVEGTYNESPKGPVYKWSALINK